VTRLILYVLVSLAVVAGLAFLVQLEGSVLIDLGGWRLQPGLGTASVALVALVLVAVIVWSLLWRVFNAPGAVAKTVARRSERRGVDALSRGFIALQAGDADQARHLAREAQRRLPDNDAALLLEAQADLALGQWGHARERYRTLIDNPRTALAALSGLYQQAVAQDRSEAALTFAHKAHALAPGVDWAGVAVFRDMIDRRDWNRALEIVSAENPRKAEERDAQKHRQAVLHTAIAQDNEQTEPATALDNALAALKLEKDFVPAALIAARVYSNRGEVRRGASLLKRVWRDTGHPQAATLYAHAQPGLAPAGRLKRMADLVPNPPESREAAVVLARAAVDAGEWVTARNALANYAPAHATQDICVLMAEIEEGQNADYGRAREWLARAVQAPRDQCWTADGVTSDEWEPVSPVTGRFDAFEWKVPVSEGHGRLARGGETADAAASAASGRGSLPARRAESTQSGLAQETAHQ